MKNNNKRNGMPAEADAGDFLDDLQASEATGSSEEGIGPGGKKLLIGLRIASVILPVVLAAGMIYCGYNFIRKAADFTRAEKLAVVFEESPDKQPPEAYIVSKPMAADSGIQVTLPQQSAQTVIEKKDYSYSSLAEQAPMAAGYLNVLSTNIQYPVMWSEDDEYYLTHSSDGNVNGNGAIFLTSSNSQDFSDPTNYIFGHNMTNGLMFRSLNSYIKDGAADKEFLSEHCAAYLVTPYETETYYLFHAEVIDPDADEYVTTGSREDISARSGVAIPNGAKMMILVTCYTKDNHKRVMVYGYKV